MKILGDSFSGIPLCFCWRLVINSFWRKLKSQLELSRWHLRVNTVWRQLGSPLGFAVPRDSVSGITPCFPMLGFTLLICSWGTKFSPVGGLLFFYFLGKLHCLVTVVYCLIRTESRRLKQSHDLPHSNWPTPDRAPSFNVCYVLIVEASERSQVLLSAAKHRVTKHHKEMDSKFVRYKGF